MTGDSGIKTVSGAVVSTRFREDETGHGCDGDGSDVVIASEADAAGIPVNVVNQASLSTFISSSIINRSPVIAAAFKQWETSCFHPTDKKPAWSGDPRQLYGRLAISEAERLLQCRQQ